MNTYQYLSQQLWPVAETAIAYFRSEWGIPKFRVEEQLDPRIQWRPTLQANTQDFHTLCVEISERPHPSYLDGVVLDCMQRCLPVRLFVAVSQASKGGEYQSDLARARQHGIGILEIDNSGVNLVSTPLSLALLGVRSIDRSKYPPRYRYGLSQAEMTFKQGDPVKGCANIYDEIEGLSRRAAARIDKKGLWKPPLKMGAFGINFGTAPWARVIQILIDNLDFKRCKTIEKALLSRVYGLTGHRNDAGHKPRTRQQLLRRDQQLRTRFETAADILLEFIQATNPLHV